MKTSDRGRKLIESFEGLRLRAYYDAIGVPTIGYGHTTAAGKPRVTSDLVITRQEADEILSRDLGYFENTVNHYVKVPLTQNQFDALVSLVLNIGTRNFATSTLLTLLNRGEYHAAAEQFRRWNKAGGRVLSGLTRRRKRERALFMASTGIK